MTKEAKDLNEQLQRNQEAAAEAERAAAELQKLLDALKGDDK